VGPRAGCGQEKYSCPFWKLKPGFAARSLVTVLTELLWLP